MAQQWKNKYIYYINSSEIPGELSRENISSHVKITCYFHMWRYQRCYGYIKKSRHSHQNLKGLVFIGRLEKRNFSSALKKTYHISPRGHVISSIYLTNRFHFAVRLFSYRSQMTSKCSKNRKVAHEPLGKRVTDVLSTIIITEQTHGKMESICFIQ